MESMFSLMIMTLLSLTVSLFLVFILRKIHQIKVWPQVEGKINLLEFRWSGAITGDAPGYYYRPQVKYSYNVNGYNYQGERLLPIGWVVAGTELDEVKASLANLQRVYYNPANPEESYLGLPLPLVKANLLLIQITLALTVFITLLLGLLLLTN